MLELWVLSVSEEGLDRSTTMNKLEGNNPYFNTSTGDVESGKEERVGGACVSAKSGGGRRFS